MFCLYLHILGECQRALRESLDDALLRSSAAISGGQNSDLRERRERMALAGLYIDLHAGALPQRYLIATQFKKDGHAQPIVLEPLQSAGVCSQARP